MKKTLFVLLVTAALSSCAGLNGRWQHELYEDPMTDHTRETAWISNTSRMFGGGGQTYAVAEIGCGNVGPFLSFDYGYKTEIASYRIDKNPPVEIQNFWNFDDVHTSAVTGDAARKGISDIIRGTTLVVRRQSLSALTRSDHVFDITNGKVLIEEVLSKCW